MLDAGRLVDRCFQVPELVIEVPKFIIEDVPMRTSVPEPQLAEQLVEVPTILSYSSLQRSVEQLVDIPVPGGGGPSSGLPGFSSGQSSTVSPSKKRISERIVEQIVDPVSRGGLPGSSSSHSPTGDEDRADEPGKGVFRTFPQIKKSAKLGSHSGSELLPESSPSTPAAQLEDSVEWVRLCGSAKGMRREGSGTGTGIRASLRLTSLLFLGEERHRQPRAVYKHWAGGSQAACSWRCLSYRSSTDSVTIQLCQ